MTAAISYSSLALDPVIRGLKNAHAFLQKAASHIEATGDDSNDYLTARLAPDMKNLIEQVHYFTYTAKSIPPHINVNISTLTLSDEDKTFPDLLARINRTIEYLEGIDDKRFEGQEGMELTMKFANGAVQVKYSTLQYVQMYAQPNFW